MFEKSNLFLAFLYIFVITCNNSDGEKCDPDQSQCLVETALTSPQITPTTPCVGEACTSTEIILTERYSSVPYKANQIASSNELKDLTNSINSQTFILLDLFSNKGANNTVFSPLGIAHSLNLIYTAISPDGAAAKQLESIWQFKESTAKAMHDLLTSLNQKTYFEYAIQLWTDTISVNKLVASYLEQLRILCNGKMQVTSKPLQQTKNFIRNQLLKTFPTLDFNLLLNIPLTENEHLYIFNFLQYKPKNIPTSGEFNFFEDSDGKIIRIPLDKDLEFVLLAHSKIPTIDDFKNYLQNSKKGTQSISFEAFNITSYHQLFKGKNNLGLDTIKSSNLLRALPDALLAETEHYSSFAVTVEKNETDKTIVFTAPLSFFVYDSLYDVIYLAGFYKGAP